MNIAIWGAGKFGKIVGKQIRTNQNIVCYIDNCAENIEDIMGIEVVSPTEYMRHYVQSVDMVLVAVLDWYAVYKQISKMNIRKYGIVSKLVYSHKLPVSNDVLRDINILYNDEIESKKIQMRRLETNVVDFCNLNCKGCSHFSNIFGKGDAIGYESFEEDIRFLSKKVFIAHFDLLGGEAFLADNLGLYIGCLRKYMPKTSITIVSNGVLIPRQSESLLTYIRENNVLVSITEYPPTSKLKDKIISTLESVGVMYEFRRKSEDFGKNIDLNGRNDPYRAQNGCRERECYFLRKGKIYKCPFSALGNYFFEQYKIPLHFEEGIDIYDENIDLREALQRIETEPIEQCRYCGTEERFRWEVSNQPEVGEWLIN
ncbi:MAG: radical SAM protein [Lachnospiraceae bacterium]|nr:radical SAM protein [Lachnospiraceae bacterium]